MWFQLKFIHSILNLKNSYFSIVSLPLGEELHIELDNITTKDVEIALRHTKPSALGMKEKYAAWQKDYESVWQQCVIDHRYSASCLLMTTYQKLLADRVDWW